MEKERKFQVDDEVEWVNDSFGRLGKRYIVIRTDEKHAYLNDNCGGHYFCHLKLIARKAHPVGTIFSVLNEKDAGVYIGKMVEFCDIQNYKRKETWKKGVLGGFQPLDSNYVFVTSDGDFYHLVRLIPESFEAPKPKVDPGLIKALKLSIQQWQIMYDTGKSKAKVYRFLGGEGMVDCFLCVSAGRLRLIGEGTKHCHKCIDWKASYCYQGNKSPFYVWREDQCKENTLLVLNHLKSELSRLDGKQ